ncbi:MAG: hypothetical protein ACYDBB_17330 [Armatimonadota bacterium]
MEHGDIDQAAQSLAYIREVLTRTATTMAGFGRVFLVWGIVLLVNSLLNQLVVKWLRPSLGTPVPPWYRLTTLLPLVLLAIMALTYWMMVRKGTVGGMGRQLVSVWAWTLILTLPLMWWIEYTMLTRGGVRLDSNLSEVFNNLLFVWVLALLFQALLFTGAMTRFAFPKWLAILYLVYGIVAMTNPFVPLLPASLLLPITLLLLGGYFEWERRRQERHGTA